MKTEIKEGGCDAALGAGGTLSILKEYHGEITRNAAQHKEAKFQKLPAGTVRFQREELGQHLGDIVAVIVDFNSPVSFRTALLVEVGQDFIGMPPDLTLSLGTGTATAIDSNTEGLLDFRTTTVDEKALFRSQLQNGA